MPYKNSLLLYQDDPDYGLPLRIILAAVPVILLGGAAYLRSTGETDGAIVLVLEAFLVGFIFWLVFPRKYQVYEDHLGILLAGQLAVRIKFDRIARVEVTNRTSLTINYATRFARTYVLIERTGALSIAITPKSNEAFAANANLALSEWKRTRGGMASPASSTRRR